MIWMRLICVTLMWLMVFGANDLYTSVMDLRELYGHEQDMKSELKSYLDREEGRLEAIKRFYKSLPEEGSMAVDYIKSPVNSFAILKRTRRDWDSTLNDLVYQDNSHDLMSFIANKRHKFADEGDLKGGLIALKRLLDTYQLSMEKVTNGSLSLDNRPIAAEECFEIGREAYKQELWEIATVWLEEAERLKQLEPADLAGVSKFDILDFLSYSQFQTGRIYSAYTTTQRLMEIVPNWAESRVEGNMKYFRGRLTAEELERGQELESENQLPTGTSLFWSLDDMKRYETLCREPVKLPPKRERNLKCFYYTNNNHPGLVINPVKIEILHDKPRVYGLKGVITPTQMERLEELGKQKLNRATARSHVSGKFEPADYRIAKSGWLSNSDDMEIFPSINQRMEYITGLEMDTAEDLQLGVYGIGGHYEPHYDHAKGEEIKSFRGNTRNRIATILLYLSNVEQGGATVFPIAGARVVPEKGDAVFWFNLLASGASDDLTRHAGCPVLVGAKIVCNKWIHEAEQEFRYPCKLSQTARNRLAEPN